MSFPDLGATGIIAAVILALTVIGFLKGLIRTLLALICLGVGGYAAFWGNEHASDLTAPWMQNPGPWMPKVIAITTGLVVFFICRYLLHFLIDPFNRSKTGKKIGFGVPAAILSLLAGLTILWLGFTGIRYGGSLAELRYTRHLLLTQDEEYSGNYAPPTLLSAKRALDASSVGKWQRDTDFLDAPDKLLLCKLLILYHHGPTRTQMLKDKALNPLLNDAAFLDLAYDSTVQKLAQSGKPRKLYHNASVDNFLEQDTQDHPFAGLKSSHVNTFVPTLLN